MPAPIRKSIPSVGTKAVTNGGTSGGNNLELPKPTSTKPGIKRRPAIASQRMPSTLMWPVTRPCATEPAGRNGLPHLEQNVAESLNGLPQLSQNIQHLLRNSRRNGSPRQPFSIQWREPQPPAALLAHPDRYTKGDRYWFRGQSVETVQPAATTIAQPTTLYHRNASVNRAVANMAASPASTPTKAPVAVQRLTKNASTKTPSMPP